MKISCVFFPWNFVVWQELASIPTAPVYWEKQEACRYLTSVQREWLLYWPFTQNLEFSELSGQGGEVVSEAGDQLRRELTRGNSFLAYHFWLVFSLEMVLALSPLGVSGLPPSGHAVAAVLAVKPLSEAFQSSSVWIPLSFRHVLLVCACSSWVYCDYFNSLAPGTNIYPKLGLSITLICLVRWGPSHM